MKKIMLVIGFLLNACGEWEAVTYQDPEFSSYVMEFEKLSQYDTRRIRIQFSEKSDDTVKSELGVCQDAMFNGKPVRTIKIRRESWKEASQDSREQLIFHELGHCLLNRSHSDSFIRRGRYVMPKSIMSTSRISDEVYKANRDYYKSELVLRIKQARQASARNQKSSSKAIPVTIK